MSLPRSFFTHLTLLAGGTFGVNTHQSAFLSRSSFFWRKCTVLEELCKTTNIFGTSYSSGSCGVWSTPGMACVAASHCLGVCQLREGESVLSSAGSLCPRSRCVPEIAEPEEPRLCSDVQLCLTSVDTVDTYSVGSCPFGRCVRARTCPEVEVCQSQVDGKARVGLCPKSKRFKCVPKKRELLPRMRYEGLPQGLTSETEVVTAGEVRHAGRHRESNK